MRGSEGGASRRRTRSRRSRALPVAHACLRSHAVLRGLRRARDLLEDWDVHQAAPFGALQRVSMTSWFCNVETLSPEGLRIISLLGRVRLDKVSCARSVAQ